MPSNLNLDYYYGSEAEQYSFYRIPKTLLTDPRYKSVSIEATATELSQKDCTIVKLSSMDRGNKVTFTEKADKPTIAFDLPAYLYVGDSAAVKTTLTGADAVAWELPRDGVEQEITGFNSDGGMLFFMEAWLLHAERHRGEQRRLRLL